jgi:hypothetical protein
VIQQQITRAASSRRFKSAALLGAVALLGAFMATPAGAAYNIGGGAITGSVAFDSGKEVPPFFSPCAPTSFKLTVDNANTSANSATVVINTQGTEYAGTVDLQGTGSSICESASTGGGNLTLTTVKGVGPNEGTISCADPATGTTLRGTYVRVYTDVSALLHGSCTINGHAATVTFAFHGEFVPTSPGQGLSSPVSSATFTGPFAVIPL